MTNGMFRAPDYADPEFPFRSGGMAGGQTMGPPLVDPRMMAGPPVTPAPGAGQWSPPWGRAAGQIASGAAGLWNQLPQGARDFAGGLWQGAGSIRPWPYAAYTWARAAMSPQGQAWMGQQVPGTEGIAPFLPQWARGTVPGGAPGVLPGAVAGAAAAPLGAADRARGATVPALGRGPGWGRAEGPGRSRLPGGRPPGGGPPGPQAPAPPGGGGGRTTQQGGPQFRNPPEGVDAVWYRAFQREHDGQTPEEFYGGQPLEGMSPQDRNFHLGWAIRDREWSQGFKDYAGKEPTDDDWRAHWHASRPGMQRPWYEGMNPGRVARIQGQRRRWRMQRRREGEGDTGQRAPNFMPPVTYWRYTE